jgi:cobyrinic acid a,c-diamide synthase
VTAAAIIVSAPCSGAGKSTVVLGLLRAYRRRGLRVSSLKVGPDFIDPAYHEAASGQPCRNIDAYCMRPETLQHQVRAAAHDNDLLIIEGVMGLFDGAAQGGASTADVAVLLGLPIVLVLDTRGQGSSAAAVALGFAKFREDVRIGGVILNRIGSPRHRAMIEPALARVGIALCGALGKNDALTLPSRHLGLLQAGEHPQLEDFLNTAADRVSESVDLNALLGMAIKPVLPALQAGEEPPPLGKHVAVARDTAFAFCYPHILERWRAQGTTVSFFSPLRDEAPDAAADAVYLPGGYPELHAAQLAQGRQWKSGLAGLKRRGAFIYGECGGYMALGEYLSDRAGEKHAMAGLLPIGSSFSAPKMTLGYRAVSLMAHSPLGQSGQAYRGHEFHYASSEPLDGCAALLKSADAEHGCVNGNVAGSFVHLVDWWR